MRCLAGRKIPGFHQRKAPETVKVSCVPRLHARSMLPHNFIGVMLAMTWRTV